MKIIDIKIINHLPFCENENEEEKLIALIRFNIS